MWVNVEFWEKRLFSKKKFQYSNFQFQLHGISINRLCEPYFSKVTSLPPRLELQVTQAGGSAVTRELYLTLTHRKCENVTELRVSTFSQQVWLLYVKVWEL